jgi:hypothetical protein
VVAYVTGNGLKTVEALADRVLLEEPVAANLDDVSRHRVSHIDS